MLEFPIDPTDTAIGVMESREHRAEAASIEKFLNPRSVAVIGASRRQDTIGHALVRNLVTGDYTGRVYVVNPQRRRGRRAAGVRHAWATSPTTVDVAVVAVPAESVQDVVLDCAAKGVHGLVVISSGFAETGEEGRQRQRRLVGPGPVLRPAADRAQLPRRHQHRPRRSRSTPRCAAVMPPRGRAGFFCQSGALGVGDPGEGATTAASACRPSSAPATAPTSPATTCCSTGRRTTRPRSCCSTWSRSATRASSPGSPAGSRRASRSSRCARAAAPRACRWATPCAGSAPRRQAVDAMFRQAGVIQVDTLDEMFDVAQLLAHQPLPRGRRVAIVGNSDALGLLAADAAAAVGLVVNQSESAGRRRDRRGLRGRPRRGHRRRRRRRGRRGLHPAAQRRPARTSPTCWPRWGSSPTSRWSPRSSAPRASPSCCGCPTSPGTPPGAARCRPTRRSRPRCARWPTSSSTPCGGGTPATRAAASTRTWTPAPPAGKRLVNEILMRHPDGHDLDPAERRRAARRPTASRAGRPRPVAHLDEALAAGEELGWNVVLKATPSACATGPTWPTCGATSTPPRRWRTPGRP